MKHRQREPYAGEFVFEPNGLRELRKAPVHDRLCAAGTNVKSMNTSADAEADVGSSPSKHKKRLVVRTGLA